MSLPWFAFNIKDFLANTKRLNTEAKGAYLCLMLDYYEHGHGAPDDDDVLAAICELPVEVWRRHRKVIEPLFTVTESVWVQSRIDDELRDGLRRHERTVAATAAAKAAREAKKSVDEPLRTPSRTKPSVTKTVTSNVTEDVTSTQEQEQTLSKEEPLASLAVRADGHTRSEPALRIKAPPRLVLDSNETAVNQPPKPSKRGTRVPPNFTIDDSDRQFAAELGLPSSVVEAETPQFIDYWSGIPGAKGLKLDWKGTWRNRMRFLKDHQPTSRGPPAVRPLTEFQRGRQELKGILNDLDSFASGSSQSSGENPRLLSRDPGQRPEAIRGGVGGDVIDLPMGSGRSRG